MLKQLMLLSLLSVLVYFLSWPVVVEPISWQAPEAPEYRGKYLPNRVLADYEPMLMDGLTGPEGVVVGRDGRVYATTEQGWILRWSPGQAQPERWVKLPGRPLGITWDNSDGFWVADAFTGVFHITAEGEQTLVLSEVAGKPLLYANDLVLAANGKLYISDSTARFSAKAYGHTYKASLVDILEHGYTGRVVEFDPVSGASREVLTGLSFANGVTTDSNGEFILVNETSEYRVWKHWLKGEKAGNSEILIDNLPGFPDNILAGQDGRYWLGFTSPRIALLDNLADKPFARKVVQRLPAWVRPKAKLYGHVLAIDGSGRIVQNLQDPEAHYPLTTGASEDDQYLYISSLVAGELARIEKSALGL
ncbi:MAG: SMP-30/gluconolactonase/LRE family protein [Candidatus Pelagadaptatus aseana]|uniref:SMP-30/gluconolactonase/LRE family protein n=1 Tax=Candidatus Pelagadaptatus aseana TaxID=3120508 RepID=UPI0039B14C03